MTSIFLVNQETELPVESKKFWCREGWVWVLGRVLNIWFGHWKKWKSRQYEVQQEMPKALHRWETICLHRYAVTWFCIFIQCTLLPESREGRLHS